MEPEERAKIGKEVNKFKHMGMGVGGSDESMTGGFGFIIKEEGMII